MTTTPSGWREAPVSGPAPRCTSPRLAWFSKPMKWEPCDGRTLALVGPKPGDVMFVCPVHDRVPGSR